MIKRNNDKKERRNLIILSIVAFLILVIYIVIKMFNNGLPDTKGPYQRSVDGPAQNTSCDNDINVIQQAEDQYYSDPEKLKYPFTIQIIKTDECTNTKTLYYENDSYDIYLYCLDEVIVHFGDETIFLKEALKSNKITMEDIQNLIPYQVHLYYGKESYIHSDKYGFAPNGLSIFRSSYGRYFIGAVEMCDDGTFDDPFDFTHQDN